MKLERALWWIASVAFAAFCVWIWAVIAQSRLVSPVFLPGPDRAWAALVKGFASGVLQHKLLGTVERMIYGWLLASLAGVALGAFVGVSPTARAYFNPLLELIRPLPASAVLPLAMALFGLSEGMTLSVIAFGALWPMLLATSHGFASVEPRLYEVSDALGLSRWAFIFKIALPSSMPDILAGMRLGLTVALILAVVGEMITSQDGLGNWILLAARSFRAADLYAGVILLGFVGLVTSLILTGVERRALRWRAAR